MRGIMLRLLLLGVVLVCLAGCGGDDARAKTVIVYSSHGKFLQGDIKQRFEAAYPQYRLEFQDIPGGGIFNKVLYEKSNPQADVWFGGSAADFNRAESEGLLEPYAPSWADKLPPGARSLSGAWVATFVSPSLIMYNRNKVGADEVPRTWEGLLDPKWKGRVAIRDVKPSATMRTVFGALIARELQRAGNVEAGFDFLKKLDANTGVYASNPTILNDYLKGDNAYALTIWTIADAPLLKSQGLPFEWVFPDPTPMPVEPLALLKNARNPEGAKAFHDFVNSPEQLVLMARERFRIPARTDLPAEQLPDWIKALKITPMPVDWDILQKNTDEWIDRWDREVKNARRS
jgi:iron(III) transport system substrate-binding protein